MRIRRVWIIFWLVLMLQEGGVFEDVYLIPTIGEVFEHENVTVTLVHPDRDTSISLWNSTVRVVNINGTCTADGYFTSLIQYHVKCNTTADSLTLLNVSRDKHMTTLKVTFFTVVGFFACTIHVNVAAEKVEIFTSANGTTITANESGSVRIRCVSSFCRPNANISLRVSGESTEVLAGLVSETNYIRNNENLVQTETNFTFTATKDFNARQIYCFARNNPEKETSSSEYKLDILYPPGSPPEIGEYQNLSVYQIREFTTRRLTCMVKVSNPPSIVDWKCEHAVYLQNNISLSQREVVFNVSRGSDANCSCSYTYSESQKVKTFIKFDVLYPPDKILVYLFLEGILYPNISSTIDVIENKEMLFNCSGNGNPNPDRFQWSGANASITDRLYLRSSRHQQNSTITCLVLNTMNETEENSVSIGNHSQTYRINVLYPPELDVETNIQIIENNSFTATCKANGGLTTKQSTNWNTSYSSSGNGSSILIIPKVNRMMKGTYRCVLNYTLCPTYGVNNTNITWRELFLDVLYPPENVVTNLTLNGNVHHNVPSAFSVVEHAQMTMVCAARGNPIPTKYTWTGTHHSDNETLQLVARGSLMEHLTCSAENTMTPTDQQSIRGIREQTYKITVLYPPKLRGYTEENVTIGTDFVTNCMEVPGQTNNITVCWTTGSKEPWQCSRMLTILNASADDSGLYNCTVHFVMRPTFGEEISISISTSVFINVLAESNVEPVVGDGPRNSVTGPVVGGTVAGVSVIIAVIGTLYFVKKRKLLSRKDEVAKSPAYTTGFAQGDVRNPYEESSNTYEGLTASATQNDKDHQYEKLRSFSNRQTGQHKLYENLELKQLN